MNLVVRKQAAVGFRRHGKFDVGIKALDVYPEFLWFPVLRVSRWKSIVYVVKSKF